MNPSNQLMTSTSTKHLVVLLSIGLACFALSPAARAQLPSPSPDGGYPGNNTAEGDGALANVQINTGTGDGTNNTAIGFDALNSNTSGNLNTATGSRALIKNTTGNLNTATGVEALRRNTTGFENTATGVSALFSNTTGFFNTATGVGALDVNSTGSHNTATGHDALFFNSTGSENTATGFDALASNTTGFDNTANGINALFSNTTGNNNTASGVNALFNNITGSFNTATGQGSLYSNRGSNNTADGQNALKSNTTGSNNVAVGSNAGKNLTTGNNNIDVSNPGFAGEANTIRIGKQGTQTSTFIAGIAGTGVTGAQVVVNSNGKLGVTTSSARFKEQVKPMDKASEAILALKPVTFRYKDNIDPSATPQFGLVAEQVAQVDPDLVERDNDGKPYTVRYEAVNAMLLNEFLKEHRKVQELERALAIVNERINGQDAKIDKVSAKVELATPQASLAGNR
jgi:hypothetical protein